VGIAGLLAMTEKNQKVQKKPGNNPAQVKKVVNSSTPMMIISMTMTTITPRNKKITPAIREE
jgi:hypothetical protein